MEVPRLWREERRNLATDVTELFNEELKNELEAASPQKLESEDDEAQSEEIEGFDVAESSDP
ncbi:hypothetical protein E4U32_004166 [Claviceps aff. humidiphila group G2b]|nr:hypothetical protein E4U32_004166 [Claviceps aff. humidiphila group G2b]